MLLSWLLLVAGAQAHITTVCTSTAPSNCGSIVFFFGTYHDQGGATGQVHITTPQGTTTIFPFQNSCFSSATTVTGQTRVCPEPDLFANCAVVVPSDAAVSCYQYDPVGEFVFAVPDSCDAFPDSGSYAALSSQYYAVVDGATTGTYTVYTSGTNVDLDPCDGSRGTPTADNHENYPCAMYGPAQAVSFPLSVAACGDGDQTVRLPRLTAKTSHLAVRKAGPRPSTAYPGPQYRLRRSSPSTASTVALQFF